MLHFGTHGSLEFMPGKQVGMSGVCYPDSLIGNLPNLYYYAANNPSEATIAKRRSYANTISYLTPPAENAGLYKGLKVRLTANISSHGSMHIYEFTHGTCTINGSRLRCACECTVTIYRPASQPFWMSSWYWQDILVLVSLSMRGSLDVLRNMRSMQSAYALLMLLMDWFLLVMQELKELIASYQTLREGGRGPAICATIIETARQCNLDRDVQLPGEDEDTKGLSLVERDAIVGKVYSKCVLVGIQLVGHEYLVTSV